MTRLGIIGAGCMAQTVLAALSHEAGSRFDLLSILSTARGQEEAHRMLKGETLVASKAVVRCDLRSFLADKPDIVVECASHSAVREHGVAILKAGCALAIASVGALVDDGLYEALTSAAAERGGRLILPSGAIGGIDLLAAARLSGLHSVSYIGRKPPKAWLGTPAESCLDLTSVQSAMTFFEGTARQAAKAYPQNANVAATIALAGLGFDKTRVELIVDPNVVRNVHEVAVKSEIADFTIVIKNAPSPSNPKTSLSAGYSLARLVLNHAAAIAI